MENSVILVMVHIYISKVFSNVSRNKEFNVHNVQIRNSISKVWNTMDLERFFSQIRQVKNFICLTFALVMSPKPTLDTHHHHSVFWRGKKVQMSTTWKKRERGKKFFRETNLLVLLQSPMSVTAQWSTIDRVSHQNLVVRNRDYPKTEFFFCKINGGRKFKKYISFWIFFLWGHPS